MNVMSRECRYNRRHQFSAKTSVTPGSDAKKCSDQPIPSLKQLTAWVENEAVLIANAITHAQISQVLHDLDRSGIH